MGKPFNREKQEKSFKRKGDKEDSGHYVFWVRGQRRVMWLRTVAWRTLRITHGEVAGSTDFGSWTRIIESPQPSWDSSHETVRGYGNRQTYLPVQDLVLVCSFVSWVTSSK